MFISIINIHNFRIFKTCNNLRKWIIILNENNNNTLNFLQFILVHPKRLSCIDKPLTFNWRINTYILLNCQQLVIKLFKSYYAY